MSEILTKKQLEDASICYKKKCSECAANKAEIMPDNCIESLAKTAITLYEMLKRSEWAYGSSGIGWCPICWNSTKQKHKPNCDLGNFLKSMEG